MKKDSLYVEPLINSNFRISDEKCIEPLLYTSGLSDCLGLGFAVREMHNHQVRYIALYHAVSDYHIFSHPVTKQEDLDKLSQLLDKANDSKAAFFIQTLSKIITLANAETDSLQVCLHFSNFHVYLTEQTKQLIEFSLNALNDFHFKGKLAIKIITQKGSSYFAVNKDGVFISNDEQLKTFALFILKEVTTISKSSQTRLGKATIKYLNDHKYDSPYEVCIALYDRVNHFQTNFLDFFKSKHIELELQQQLLALLKSFKESIYGMNQQINYIY